MSTSREARILYGFPIPDRLPGGKPRKAILDWLEDNNFSDDWAVVLSGDYGPDFIGEVAYSSYLPGFAKLPDTQLKIPDIDLEALSEIARLLGVPEKLIGFYLAGSAL